MAWQQAREPPQDESGGLLGSEHPAPATAEGVGVAAELQVLIEARAEPLHGHLDFGGGDRLATERGPEASRLPYGRILTLLGGFGLGADLDLFGGERCPHRTSARTATSSFPGSTPSTITTGLGC